MVEHALFLFAECGTTFNEDHASLTTVSHVWQDGIRDVHGTKEVCVHHIHHLLSPVTKKSQSLSLQ